MENRFKEGQIVWILQDKGMYRKGPSDQIRRVVYRGPNDRIELLAQVQNITPDGGLGMTFDMSIGYIFESLEELKKYFIQIKSAEVTELQSQIKSIHDEMSYVSSMKDIQEDREKKINEILQ